MSICLVTILYSITKKAVKHKNVNENNKFYKILTFLLLFLAIMCCIMMSSNNYVVLRNFRREDYAMNTNNTVKISDYPDVLTPEDLQKILKIGRNTVYAVLADGTIKSKRIAGKYRIPKGYLLDYMYPDQQNNPKYQGA